MDMSDYRVYSHLLKIQHLLDHSWRCIHCLTNQVIQHDCHTALLQRSDFWTLSVLL